MSRKKKRSKADEFEMDEAGYDEYTNSPAEQHIYEGAVSAEPEYRAPKAKKKKRKKGGSTALWLIPRGTSTLQGEFTPSPVIVITL